MADPAEYLLSVTAKKRLHDLVESMSERDAETLLEKAEKDKRDPLLELLDNAPLDDEPVTPEDEAASREALEAYRRGDFLTADEAKRELL